MELQQRGQQPKTSISKELPKTDLPSFDAHVSIERTYHGIRHRDGSCEGPQSL